MTTPTDQAPTARRRLETLCAVTPDRRPGSRGNSEATTYVAEALRTSGWATADQEFDCLDWETGGGTVTIGDHSIRLEPSPYGLGIDVAAPLRVLRTVEDLDRPDLDGAIVLLTGALAAEPLTPKAFPFYGSEEHAHIIAALERATPGAVIAVTGRYPELCGALDPFPLIEDGDFTIPTANVHPKDAQPLLAGEGAPARVTIEARRRRARARNVVGTRGPQTNRVTVIAHIDTKPGTPGAVDNAAGVVVLLLLADLLGPATCPHLPIGVELLAVNGEDHYAAPGELAWLAVNDLEDVALAVNIDGAGYRAGASAYSTYNLSGTLAGHVGSVLGAAPGLVSGPEWFQSDHAIFAMRGRPAVAVTSQHFEEMLEVLFHAPTDTPDQVEVTRLGEIADAVAALVTTWPT